MFVSPLHNSVSKNMHIRLDTLQCIKTDVNCFLFFTLTVKEGEEVHWRDAVKVISPSYIRHQITQQTGSYKQDFFLITKMEIKVFSVWVEFSTSMHWTHVFYFFFFFFFAVEELYQLFCLHFTCTFTFISSQMNSQCSWPFPGCSSASWNNSWATTFQMRSFKTTVKWSNPLIGFRKATSYQKKKKKKSREKEVKRMKMVRPTPFDWMWIVNGKQIHGIHVPGQSSCCWSTMPPRNMFTEAPLVAACDGGPSQYAILVHGIWRFYCPIEMKTKSMIWAQT